MSVEALDLLVRGFLYTLWALAALAFAAGAVLLHRHNAGQHHAPDTAVDTGHQPAHARPARPPLWARLGAALLHGWREMAHAHALVTGGQTW